MNTTDGQKLKYLTLEMTKTELDKANKDKDNKIYKPDFKVSIPHRLKDALPLTNDNIVYARKHVIKIFFNIFFNLISVQNGAQEAKCNLIFVREEYFGIDCSTLFSKKGPPFLLNLLHSILLCSLTFRHI